MIVCKLKFKVQMEEALLKNQMIGDSKMAARGRKQKASLL
jgi:hypothetical protein